MSSGDACAGLAMAFILWLCRNRHSSGSSARSAFPASLRRHLIRAEDLSIEEIRHAREGLHFFTLCGVLGQET